MIKKLNSKNKKFYKILNKFLELRKKYINLRDLRVFKIIDDIKKK